MDVRGSATLSPGAAVLVRRAHPHYAVAGAKDAADGFAGAVVNVPVSRRPCNSSPRPAVPTSSVTATPRAATTATPTDRSAASGRSARERPSSTPTRSR